MSTTTNAAILRLATLAAAQHVDLSAVERDRRKAEGWTDDQCDEWMECLADPSPCMGLWQTYQDEGHPTDQWNTFCQIFAASVEANATVRKVPRV